MNLYILEPEVSGEIGSNTIYKNFNEVRDNKAKPIISKLHFIFYGWLGDDLIESTPCFIVTENLMTRIINSNLKGYEFQDLEISLSDEFKELYPNKTLPLFKRLVPKGEVFIGEDNCVEYWNGEDFNLSNKLYLVVSEKVLRLLENHYHKNCEINKLNFKNKY